MSSREATVRRWSAVSRMLTQFAHARPAHSRPQFGLSLERLEDRAALSGFNLTVTSLADNGPGTLRSAITEADAGSAGHAYNIKINVSGTITLESALPDLSHSLNLSGPGASRLTVRRDDNASSRFGIFAVDSGVAVKISGMTIANGWVSYSGSGAGIDNAGTLALNRTTISGSRGGSGIHNVGTLAVSHSVLTENLAADGGGIDNSGTLTVSFTTIFHNFAAGNGGGVDNTGMLTVKQSTILGNHVGSGIIGPAMVYPEGGGIYNDKTGTLNLSRTTISGNGAYRGAGIFNIGTAIVSRATITGDTAGDSGGGISNTGMLTVKNTTISRNSASYAGDGINNSGSLTVGDSTISGNSGGNGSVGGGINNSGSLTVSDTKISGNRGGTGCVGGGINNTGSAMISGTTIAGNTEGTGSLGGGISNSGPLTVSRTNISRNSATTGGGLYNSGGGLAEVDYSTINNHAGGGVVNNDAPTANAGSIVRLRKTVVDGIRYKQFQYGP